MRDGLAKWRVRRRLGEKYTAIPMCMGACRVFVLPTVALLAVIVIYEWWLVKTLREEIAYERTRKGFHTRRYRKVAIAFGVLLGLGLVVVGLILVRAILLMLSGYS